MSLKELEKLEDRHTQGAAFNDYPILWSSLMERFHLCEEIVRAEANEDIPATGQYVTK